MQINIYKIKLVYSIQHFMYGLILSGMLILASECVAAGDDEVLLFMGQDPKPGSSGAVAYKVTTKRFEALPEWGPDTGDVPPPLDMSAAASIAAVDIVTRYNYNKERLRLSVVSLWKASHTSRNVWYYVITYEVNIAKNAFFPHPSERVDIRVVVLMDGRIVAPSVTELSRQINFQELGGTIEKL